MRVFAWVSFVVGLLLWPGAGGARELILAPTSKWVVNYSADGCTLLRSFGEDENRVIAQFVKIEPAALFDLNLQGNVLAAWRRSPILNLRFGDRGEFLPQAARRLVPDPKSAGSIAFTMFGRLDNRDFRRVIPQNQTRRDREEWRRADPAGEASVTSVSIQAGGLQLKLELGPMQAPMSALNKCASELVASWGLDPLAMQNLALMPDPIGTPDDWFLSFAMRRQLASDSAQIRYRLLVNERGAPTDCIILSAIGRESLVKAMCSNLISNVRFWPAETKDGKTVAAYYVGEVMFFRG